jgi:hypothetical protein
MSVRTPGKFVGMQVACLCIFAVLVSAQAQSVTGLVDVHTIFVDSLGQGENSGLIRDKIINRLSQSPRFQVVLDADKADAILTGSGESSYGGAVAVVRLITKDHKILWVYETHSTVRPRSRSRSSDVADKIVKELLKAAASPKKS